MTQQYSRISEKGAEVLAIVRSSMAAASEYFQVQHIPFPCLVDYDRKVYELYWVQSKLVSLGQRPALFIIDPQGIVQFAQIGWQQWQIPAADEVLRRLDSLSGE